MNADERALYIISVAAELAGVHPQTLRIYERKGLIEPARTQGRSRRYSERDLAVLRRIQELTNDGVSLAGVKKVLELEVALDDAQWCDPESLEHGEHHALGLAHERGEEMLRRDLGVVAVTGQRLAGGQRLLGLAGESVGVERHGSGHLGVNGYAKVDNLALRFIPSG